MEVRDTTVAEQPLDVLERHMMRQQLGEHTELAHAARDQLRVLAPVIEDENLLSGCPRRGWRGRRERGVLRTRATEDDARRVEVSR